MKLIHFAKVEIPAAPLKLQRKFYFSSQQELEAFIRKAAESVPGIRIPGFGIEHLMTAGEVIAECQREAASVDALHI